MTPTVLVCGGRTYANRSRLFEVLDELASQLGCFRLVTGGARGADFLALDWACFRQHPFEVYFAAWATEGRRAGPLRNARMLEAEAVDLVVAFRGGAGTADMVQRAQAKGVRVHFVDPPL